MTVETIRRFDVIPRRRYVLVAECLGDQRTARWMRDTTTGTWYVAESWKRPNLNRPLTADQAEYVWAVIA